MKKIKIMMRLTIIISGIIILVSSCTKVSDETGNNQQTIETETISDTNFSETLTDLLTVDYKEFYEQLEPHGQWIEVTGDDVGVNTKELTAASNREHKKISFAELFGIKDAYASVNFGMFFVWQPSPELSVGITAGTTQPGPVYVPYTRGRWIYTNAGWYFRAPTPHEEITMHYGRWVYSPVLGWVWMPGRVWAPAWVDWRENDEYIAWTPLHPSIHIFHSIIIPPPVVEHHYILVEKRHFSRPDIYKYMYKENRNRIMIKEMRRSDGVMIMNKTIINKGPDINYMRQITGDRFEPVKIEKVRKMSDVNYASDKYSVYSPQFRKVKEKPNEKAPLFKPNKYVKADEIKSNDKNNFRNKDISQEDNNSKKEDRDINIKDQDKINRKQTSEDRKTNGKENFNSKKNNNENRMNKNKDGNKQSKENKTYKEKQDKNIFKEKQSSDDRKENRSKENLNKKQEKNSSQEKRKGNIFKEKRNENKIKDKQNGSKINEKRNGKNFKDGKNESQFKEKRDGNNFREKINGNSRIKNQNSQDDKQKGKKR